VNPPSSAKAPAHDGPVETGHGQAEDQAEAQRIWFAHLRHDDPAGRVLTAKQWDVVLQLATHHQLRGLTYRLLADGPLAHQVPPAVHDPLRATYVDTAVRNAVLFRQTSEMAGALAASGIPVMLLKGIHLARFVYSEPALRSMADVDLMVPRDRLAEAERVMIERGYGPLPRPDLEAFCTWSNHLAKLTKAGAPVLELHWGIERPTCPFRIDLDGLWARSREATLEGSSVRILSPEDLLLHLALHGSYHHRFDRSALKGLVDIDAVVAKHGSALDWAALVARANQWGASGFGYTIFRLAGEILGTPFPATALAGLDHTVADEEMVELARRYVTRPRVDLPSEYTKLAQTQSLGERWRLLLRNVFLPREALERVYGLRRGTPWAYGYYLVRIADLVARRGGLLLRTLFRTRATRSALDREEDRVLIEKWVGYHPAEERAPRPG
jgi:hypothetical protein